MFCLQMTPVCVGSAGSAHVNKLSLNINKTKLIIFGNRPNAKGAKIMIDNVEIEWVSNIYF